MDAGQPANVAGRNPATVDLERLTTLFATCLGWNGTPLELVEQQPILKALVYAGIRGLHDGLLQLPVAEINELVVPIYDNTVNPPMRTREEPLKLVDRRRIMTVFAFYQFKSAILQENLDVYALFQSGV